MIYQVDSEDARDEEHKYVTIMWYWVALAVLECLQYLIVLFDHELALYRAAKFEIG